MLNDNNLRIDVVVVNEGRSPTRAIRQRNRRPHGSSLSGTSISLNRWTGVSMPSGLPGIVGIVRSMLSHYRGLRNRVSQRPCSPRAGSFSFATTVLRSAKPASCRRFWRGGRLVKGSASKVPVVPWAGVLSGATGTGPGSFSRRHEHLEPIYLRLSTPILVQRQCKSSLYIRPPISSSRAVLFRLLFMPEGIFYWRAHGGMGGGRQR